MARFPSLPEQPHLADAFKRFGRGIWPLCEYHDAVLRGASEWSIAERELMAAFVSGLNACQFCHGSHRMIAELHGILRPVQLHEPHCRGMRSGDERSQYGNFTRPP